MPLLLSGSLYGHTYILFWWMVFCCSWKSKAPWRRYRVHRWNTKLTITTAVKLLASDTSKWLIAWNILKIIFYHFIFYHFISNFVIIIQKWLINGINDKNEISEESMGYWLISHWLYWLDTNFFANHKLQVNKYI